MDAAAEARSNVDMLNAARVASGLPPVAVDLALRLGDVRYGHVGATDRLDFTGIGPAVNGVARIEALCEPLDSVFLLSAEFAASVDCEGELSSLGRRNLKGVGRAKEIFAHDRPPSRSKTGWLDAPDGRSGERFTPDALFLSRAIGAACRDESFVLTAARRLLLDHAVELMDVSAWLRDLGLTCYESAFWADHIDASVLPDLTADDLRELGVLSAGIAASC